MDGPDLLVPGAALVVAMGAIVLGRLALHVVGVHGDSMTPTFQHGDQLLVLRRWFRRGLRVGDVVVCLPPPGVVITDADTQLMVKRVAAMPDGRSMCSVTRRGTAWTRARSVRSRPTSSAGGCCAGCGPQRPTASAPARPAEPASSGSWVAWLVATVIRPSAPMRKNERRVVGHPERGLHRPVERLPHDGDAAFQRGQDLPELGGLLAQVPLRVQPGDDEQDRHRGSDSGVELLAYRRQLRPAAGAVRGEKRREGSTMASSRSASAQVAAAR